MSLVCTRISSVCHSYVLVCQSYVTHAYVTRMYSYATSVCHSHVVLPWTFSVHTSIYEWHKDDIRVHASDIQMTHEYIWVTYGWYTSIYEYIRVTYGWHTSTYKWHTVSSGMHRCERFLVSRCLLKFLSNLLTLW